MKRRARAHFVSVLADGRTRAPKLRADRRRAAIGLLAATVLVACGGDLQNNHGGTDAALADAHSDSAPACEPDGWRVFEARDLFRFRAPCSLQGGPEQGIDSLIGRYSDEGLVMSYDYGGYSSTLEEWSEHTGYSKQPTTIDGRAGYFVTAEEPGASEGLSYLAGLHIPDVGGGKAALTVYGAGNTGTRRDVLLAILATIDFP